MMPKTISSYYASDHGEIDGLFEESRALRGPDPSGSHACYREFKTRLERHIGWEEEILFPLFESHTGMSDGGPTAVMRGEHRQIKQFINTIDTKLQGGDAAVEADEAELLQVLAAHSWKEEHVLYPLIDRQVSPEERDEVFARMGVATGDPTPTGR